MYCAWGLEEQGEATPLIFKLIASLFYIFRFPVLTLFDFFNSEWLLLGLAINSVLYAFVVERVFYVKNNFKKIKK